MDAKSPQKLRVSGRSLWLIGGLCTLLLGSAGWNIRQHWSIEKERLRVTVMEREEAIRAKAEAEQAQARRANKAEQAAADARVQQLYREIDSLTRINERILEQPQPGVPRNAADPGEAGGTP